MKFLLLLVCPCLLLKAAPDLADVTLLAGLGNEFYGSPTRHSLGVVWFDANNDGFPDIFATNGYDDGSGNNLRPHLYLNNSDGTFTLADHLLPPLPNYEYVGARAADYDRDGDNDLFIYTAHEQFSIHGTENSPLSGPPNFLLQNQFIEDGGITADPLFTDVADAAGLNYVPPELDDYLTPEDVYQHLQTRSACFLDYDLDGWIDLYVGQMVMNRAAAIDPVQDAAGKVANMDILFRNQGDGTFAMQHEALRTGDATKRSALVAVSGHLNDDLWPDIYVGNVGNLPLEMTVQDYRDAILINDGQGHFDLGFSNLGGDTPAAMGIDFADLNFDGKFDIYITDISNHFLDTADNTGNTLYFSTPTGYQATSAARRGVAFDLSWGTNMIDFDLDGRPSIFVGSGRVGTESVIFHKQRGQGLQTARLKTTNVRGSAVADYDQDGDPDLLLVNQDGGLQLFRNEAQESTNKAVIVEIIPSLSNPDGIGLRATLTTSSGHRLLRQIKGGTSSHSQDFTRELYFGIRNQNIAELKIEWPHRDGETQIFHNISLTDSCRITVTEPDE